ncbi:MAG: pyridoxal phosphate-dependent aminotransferase [Rhizobiaceae bacterium]|nr:pyridoxal phosphate-dependent aminotransferase [Rhizobiaceae bacterium]
MSLIDNLREEARLAPESGIVAVANYGWSKGGVIPLWAGEGDLPSPGFISDAASRALAAGETFYTRQRGIPELRQALADYHGRLYGRPFAPDEFFVTGGGMHAIVLALQATAGKGDEVVYLEPAWPNIAGAAGVAGATPVPVRLSPGDNGWSLDVQRVADAVMPRTRVLFVNSPANPTGWTASKEELRELLELARRRGLWIIADETYARFFYDGPRAPSFLDVMEPEDHIVFVNTFSKNWAMTGWRVGWLSAHPALGQVVENLVQYSTSGVAPFMQRGAVAALEQGEYFLASQVERARTARDIVSSALAATGRARAQAPQGAFYQYFAVDGMTDSLKACFDIIDRAGVGLAPGTAFGAGGEGWFRLCFHRRLDQIETAAGRLAEWIAAR